MIFGMTIYEMLWYFCMYSFLGWVLEVAYHGVTLGKVINRGFLNGPVCPVYGFGMIAVLLLGNALEQAENGIQVMTGTDEFSLLLLFVGGMILTTAVELIGGWALDKLFHTRWWDYSNVRFNFRGYICLKFSLIWGLAVVFVVRVIQPLMEARTAKLIPEKYGWPILGVIYVIMIADCIVTVLTVIGLNKKLEELEQLRKSMRVPSDKLSEKVGNASITAAQHIQEGEVQAALAKAELRDAAAEKKDEMQKRMSATKAEAEKLRDDAAAKMEAIKKSLLEKKPFGAGRLLRAFPDMKSHNHQEIVEELKG